MKISAKVDYACRALVELSLHWPSEAPLTITVIAQRQEIPIKFLTHILIQLKQMGYAESVRGKSGGYRLIKNPRQILLSEVILGFDGMGIKPEDHAPPGKDAVLAGIWREVDQLVMNRLQQISFAEIAKRYRVNNEALMFDI